VLRDENVPSGVTRRIPGAIRSLEVLLTESSLAGEVELRIGYFELRRRHWPDALARFETARGKTTDETLLATADYMAGWVQEQLGQLDEAVAAYRRALIRFPTMRNLASRLSALLFLRDERNEAYVILDRALNARPIPVDLMTSLERGDGRFVGEWLATVRQLLPGMSGS
jgi:tetratricopeptide (TPR) repeat protein